MNQAMKVEGPLHVVCQCDKCKAESQEPVVKLQEPTVERAWFTIAELNAWAEKKLSENPHWVMPKDEPEQEPVTYDKTEMNCFVQELYDRKMCEGKHGHYETMFHCVHQAIKRVAPPAPQRTWVGLTKEEIEASKPPLSNDAVVWELAVEWAEAKLKEKNGY